MQDILYKKIALTLSFLILSNYLFLSLNFFPLVIKINYIIFLITIIYFYLKNFSEHIYLKIFFLFILFISLGVPTFDWDPRSNYLFHAKRIFYDQNIFSVADNYASFSHNEYPTLVPAFASSLATLIGHWNEVFPKLSFSFMFLPPLILTYVFLKKTKYLIFLSIVFFTIGKYLFNGWADGLVAVYFVLSTLLMYLLILDKTYIYKKNSYLYLLAFCFFTSLTLIKHEGFALLIIIFIVTFLTKILRKNLDKNIYKIFLLSFSFLPILFWKIFCFRNGIGVNDYINLETSSHLLSRLVDPQNYKLIFYFLLLNEKLLICLTFFLLSFFLNKDKEIFIFILSISTIYIFVLFFIYLSTPYDFYFQLESSATRVVKSLSLLFAFFGLYNLKDYKIN